MNDYRGKLLFLMIAFVIGSGAFFYVYQRKNTGHQADQFLVTPLPVQPIPSKILVRKDLANSSFLSNLTKTLHIGKTGISFRVLSDSKVSYYLTAEQADTYCLHPDPNGPFCPEPGEDNGFVYTMRVVVNTNKNNSEFGDNPGIIVDVNDKQKYHRFLDRIHRDQPNFVDPNTYRKCFNIDFEKRLKGLACGSEDYDIFSVPGTITLESEKYVVTFHHSEDYYELMSAQAQLFNSIISTVKIQ